MNDSLDVVAQLLMKKGLLQAAEGIRGIGDVFHFIGSNIGSGFLWLGILIYAFNFLVWIIVLSRIDLSVAVPVASTNYVTLPLLAIFFLHETVPPLRWAGIFLIMIGIHFVSKSSHRAAEIEAKT